MQMVLCRLRTFPQQGQFVCENLAAAQARVNNNTLFICASGGGCLPPFIGYRTLPRLFGSSVLFHVQSHVRASGKTRGKTFCRRYRREPARAHFLFSHAAVKGDDLIALKVQRHNWKALH